MHKVYPQNNSISRILWKLFLVHISDCRNQDSNQTADWKIKLFFRVILVTEAQHQTLAYANYFLQGSFKMTFQLS